MELCCEKIKILEEVSRDVKNLMATLNKNKVKCHIKHPIKTKGTEKWYLSWEMSGFSSGIHVMKLYIHSATNGNLIRCVNGTQLNSSDRLEIKDHLMDFYESVLKRTEELKLNKFDTKGREEQQTSEPDTLDEDSLYFERINNGTITSNRSSDAGTLQSSPRIRRNYNQRP